MRKKTERRIDTVGKKNWPSSFFEVESEAASGLLALLALIFFTRDWAGSIPSTSSDDFDVRKKLIQTVCYVRQKLSIPVKPDCTSPSERLSGPSFFWDSRVQKTAGYYVACLKKLWSRASVCTLRSTSQQVMRLIFKINDMYNSIVSVSPGPVLSPYN